MIFSFPASRNLTAIVEIVKMIDMINSYESDNKDIFERISNEIFIELVNV